MGWIEMVGLQQCTGAETTKPLEESGGTGLSSGDSEIT